MNSVPSKQHTAYGQAHARRTLESDHRYNGHDGHVTAACKLCVQEYLKAREQAAWNDTGLAQ